MDHTIAGIYDMQMLKLKYWFSTNNTFLYKQFNQDAKGKKKKLLTLSLFHSNTIHPCIQ